MSFIINWLTKKPEKQQLDSISIFINDKKSVSLAIDDTLTAAEVCSTYSTLFSNRNKNPDLRLMLSIEKTDGTLVSKRVLSPFERVFNEYFRENNEKTLYKYQIIDMNDFIMVRLQMQNNRRR